MSYLLDIISKKKKELPIQVEKLVNVLYNKIKNDSYYPDEKNIIKLKIVSTTEVNIFLLECLAEYNKTERKYLEHHDPVSLRGVWGVLAFSKDKKVIKYFDDLLDSYFSEKPFYLNFLFDLFGFLDVQHPLYDKIKDYYDENLEKLPSYKLIKELEITPPNIYDWSISFFITTDGECFMSKDYSDEQKDMRYSFSMRFGNPLTLNNSYEIRIESGLSQKRKSVMFSDNEFFEINVDKSAIDEPDLMNLSKFVNNVEAHFGIKFNFDKIPNISVSKGIKRKVIENWIKKKFTI